MLPSEFEEVVNVLRSTLRNVQRLTNLRTPHWYRHVTAERQEKLRLNEIQEFKTAAAIILSVIKDKDVQREPLPWRTLQRHVENIPLWLDRLVHRPEDYEKYKTKLLMMLDKILENEDTQERVVPSRVPTTSSWIGRQARNLAAGIALAAGMVSMSGYGTRAWAEEPKQMQPEIKKEVKVEDFTDDLAKKIVESYKTPRKLFDDKEFANVDIHYVTEREGKSDRADILKSIKGDACLEVVLPVDKESEDLVRLATAAKYAAAASGLPLIVYDAKLKSFDADFAPVVKDMGNEMSYTAMVLNCKYDLVKGETKEKNDGKMKTIDIMRGAPPANDVVKATIRNTIRTLILTNVTEPNGEYVWRTQNKEPKDGKMQWFKVAYQK